MGTKVILFYLHLKPKNMVLLENGQCIIKMKNSPLLPLVHKGRSPSSLLKDLSAPPGTPFPSRRPTLPDDTKTRREALTAQPPPRRRLQYDEDDDDQNKENQPPDVELDPRDSERRKYLLQWILAKLAEDIQQFQDQVYHDLSDLRRKLGIPS